ncbi:MAG: 5-dehydro-4-deoxy-D-glucuronate isomerase [Bacteroidetes bacterium GWF2_41_61]|nr:MAG: 5-dehydro-4-deoxy-D-glucuronate isomerase [Bacteroidetes bacterium GWE2_40_15]OFY32565.1 MAG: 5-dehydro-4-deoxy-D-glucuronate isomerase [Bacteroidetes bacterium GWF2_41_61]OFY91731.1 MAG: 5-dehydro-4-deoxy-D-glucuronate isomerase [Bacteroidetes bacterium RIFOXYA12_FULL_40_10]HBG24101.1 5-dehydro-4-deoxy-D-glucuronate isomerase [Rikenellaceae bacterium]HBZ26420.1 5-dehydro-4-deoxy-D-glucuronate isomerase [Rikenellaceae bacterium]
MKSKCEVRYASHPNDVKSYDTTKIREHFLVEKLFFEDELNITYSMVDRMVAGGAMPVKESIELEALPIFKADYFTSRRELGVVNIGGEGVISVGDDVYSLNYKEALYIGRGDKKIVFSSKDSNNPAKFYFNSVPAHASYPDKLITRRDAIVIELGKQEECNRRVLNKLIVSETVQTCQLQLGMTELLSGSVWNTMPAHTHERRMEVYFYFEVPQGQSVCHFMGEPNETRHIWISNEQAVISPVWSIHSACATSNYTFIWGMGGENSDYTDMKPAPTAELR